MSQKNNPLELYIAEKLKPIDEYARPTKASGASTELGDVYNKHFLVECVSGDTYIKKHAGGKRKAIITIREAFNYQNKKMVEKYKYIKKDGTESIYIYHTNKSWWEKSKYPLIYSLDVKQDKINLNRMKKIIFSGYKQVYKITTRLGFSIKASKEHLFLSNYGWRALQKLKINDCLAIINWSKYRYNRKIVSKSITNFHKKLKKERGCEKCGLKKCLEVHHKDGNRYNNNLNNLQVLCADCHRKLKKGRYPIIKEYYFDRIDKIEKLGIEDCYDIEMEGSENNANFIANEFLVHNCKQQLTTDNPKINRKTWYKLVSELYQIGKTAFLALENKSGDRFIVMDSEDFFDLIYKNYGGNNG